MRVSDRTSRRDPEAGITLIETLVVLALLGIAAGAVGLGLGALARGATPGEEADLLAARMRLASEEALLSGAAAALLWDEAGYRFVVLQDGGWVPHPLPALRMARAIPQGLRLAGEAEARSGTFTVTADDIPAQGQALRLTVTGRDEAVTIVWDGATALVDGAAP